MGFWHTGYIEFHEPTGIDPPIVPTPRRFFCDRCDRSFASRDQLDDHRFEGHPQRRPVMILRSRELGASRTRITRPILPSEVRIDCDRAWMNGVELPVPDLPSALANLPPSGVSDIQLRKDGVTAHFDLEFRIASEPDLKRVESRFLETVRGRRLNSQVVDEFIGDKHEFDTAIGYCDGISTYLYGILAREQTADSSGATSAYRDYEKKFNSAAETLQGYDRPIARTIVGLIEFHFNHFAESASIAPDLRVGAVSKRYREWISVNSPAAPRHIERTLRVTVKSHNAADSLDELLTDRATEQIIRWSLCSQEQLAPSANDIESFLNSDLPAYDSAKLHVLLGEIHAASDDSDNAAPHAQSLLHTPPFEKWAESVIASLRW